MWKGLALCSGGVIFIVAIDVLLSVALLASDQSAPGFLFTHGVLSRMGHPYGEMEGMVFRATSAPASAASVAAYVEASAPAMDGETLLALWENEMGNGTTLDTPDGWAPQKTSNTWRGHPIPVEYIGVTGPKFLASAHGQTVFVKAKDPIAAGPAGPAVWWRRIRAIQNVLSTCGLDVVGPVHAPGMLARHDPALFSTPDSKPTPTSDRKPTSDPKPTLVDLSVAIPGSATLQRIAENLPPRALGNVMAVVGEHPHISSRVVLAAFMDFLLAYSDRHVGNILLDGDATLWVIDSHEYSLGESKRDPRGAQGPASLFLPGTKHFADHAHTVHPRSLLYRGLDVRCHVSPTWIRDAPHSLPLPLASCLSSSLANSSVSLMSRFPGLTVADASVLRERALHLLQHGVSALFPPPDARNVPPPCCAASLYPKPLCVAPSPPT